MGSLKCPLCCRVEFPNRRALQQHLLDVLDLLKCPTCSKSFTSILGLVQHLSLSSCNVEVGVNFDEHFVTYVDCSFMKTNKQEKKTTVVSSDPLKIQMRPETVQHITTIPETSLLTFSDDDVAAPNNMTTDEQDMGVVIECAPGDMISDGEIICINFDHGVTGVEVLGNNKVVQKSAAAAAAATTIVTDTPCRQADRTQQDCAKKIVVPHKRNGPQTSKQNVSLMEESDSVDGIIDIRSIYQCEVCSQIYNSKFEFESHDCGKFSCDVCSATSKTQRSLKLHQKMHERESLERKMNEPCTETFECNKCGDTISKSMSDVHLLHHTIGLKIFNCKLCTNAYLSLNSLNEHLNTHGNCRPYTCDVCHKVFKTIGYLKIHMEIHKSVKQYLCSYCGKAHLRQADRRRHEYIHTGEKPLECNICGKRFRANFSLKIHLTSHSNERPFECTTCHKRFKSQAVYSHHIKLHGEARPYACPHCPKTFKNQVALAGHKNRHIKPYSCDFCQRRFASKYDVKLHMPIHNNQESKDRFTCLICDAVYARQSTLVEHLKEHESIEKGDKHKINLQTTSKLSNILQNEESYSHVEIDLEHVINEVFIGHVEEVKDGSSMKVDDDLQLV